MKNNNLKFLGQTFSNYQVVVTQSKPRQKTDSKMKVFYFTIKTYVK